MRRLLLLRHAKAERSQPGGRDHDRVLPNAGRNDAASRGRLPGAPQAAFPTGRWFRPRRGPAKPGTLVATAFVKAPPAEFDGRIYEAPPEAILQDDQGNRHRRPTR